MRFRAIFSYYGGKSKIAHLYPYPKYGRIVEPFAGGASYSALYYPWDVQLYDIDERVAAIWEFLLRPDALEWVEYIPDRVEVGDNIDDLLLERCPVDPPEGLIYLCRAEADVGTMGAKGDRKIVTWMGKKRWHLLKQKLYYWIPKIRHWKFEKRSWDEVPVDGPATWFIDPPYQSSSGRGYLHDKIDYLALREWCMRLPGQVIVCGSTDDSWLPFAPLTRKRGITTRFQKFSPMEGIWVRDG